MLPQALVFDLDGVITDTAELHYLAWKKLADELGMYFDKEQNEALKGVSRIGSFEIILKNNNKLDAYTYEEKEKLANYKNEYYKELIETLTPKDILPGIEQLLIDARAKGIKTAVASVSKNAPRVLERIGLTKYFDTVADAAKVKNSKPDPEIFLTCSTQLGVDPKNCIGIEDAQAGIEGILSAGMYAVGINVTLTGSAPDLMLNSTAELSLELLEQNFPVAPLKIAALDSCKDLGQKINDYIVTFRKNAMEENPETSVLIITHYPRILEYIKPDYVHVLKIIMYFLIFAIVIIVIVFCCIEHKQHCLFKCIKYQSENHQDYSKDE